MESDQSDKNQPDRFDHIEVGQDIQRTNENAQEGKCAYCGTMNEPDRARCRGCFRKMPRFIPLSEQDQEIEVGGVTYRRSDPNCPEDIRILMDRVAKEGYSITLMQEWRYWRATRHAQGATSRNSQPRPTLPNESNSQSSWRYRMPNWTEGFGWQRPQPQDRITVIILIILSLIGLILRWRSPWLW